ncbi:kinase-like protein, partial [Lophiostoma macrostomum CBS 122681]
MGRTKSTPRHSLTKENFTSHTGTATASLPAFYSSEGSPGFESAYRQPLLEDTPHLNFISLLAQTQVHNVDIISLTWMPHLENVGFGGTAQLSQSLVNAHTSLVFKRPKILTPESYSQMYQAFISEICILSQDPIRNHPNIVRLQGICFEVSRGDTVVRPVIVLEKAKYGDLRAFMKTERGSSMTLRERLDMLLQIASALDLLHQLGVIHGDINPKNVLIYEENGRIMPRVSNFGYSTICARHLSDNSIVVPKTEPWNAPEHTFDERSFESAQKMDVYSMALLCMWLLFYDQVSGFATLS